MAERWKFGVDEAAKAGALSPRVTLRCNQRE